MTDKKSIIWGTKTADYYGIPSVIPAYVEWNHKPNLGKDLLFGYDADLYMSPWWNQRVSETISSQHPIVPGIDNRSSLYKNKLSDDRLLKDMNSVETAFRYIKYNQP